MALPMLKVPIQSTAGAITIRNEKGDLTMEKVKVSRYVTGKRPEFAPESDSDEDDEPFEMQKKAVATERAVEDEEADGDVADRRLRRLRDRRAVDSDDDEDEDRVARHRREVIEPEVIEEVSEEEDRFKGKDEEESSEEEELDEEEIERRRVMLRQRALQKRHEEEEEVLRVEEEKSDGDSEEESSEYEEYSDSEEETGPRLKPVFVRKRDRVTIQEKEREELRQKEMELEKKKSVEDRRKQTLKIVEDEARKEYEEQRSIMDAADLVETDDENDEEEYESWKVRELKRLKRDREEREKTEKEKLEIERLRNMTEDERRQEFRQNPKQITNKAPKGKYKFLQKYYHRGAFFIDEDDQVFKQDFSSPTLEDHFDKTILPKVMQVKNFGRSGRTKYTHLLDQDTTQFDSPWISDTAQNLKFHTAKGGGMKQVFDRPSGKQNRT
ncbi:microfibrillar-associated protein 1-like [Gigantopelta aegis]|uniref:microfibrillar-associated protein 1-like n=1 Tax=Gigantopelta aegis TaxID=1735272 RepID=UPI001B88CD5A|nr:microfibrillar-associated protein 1-like [Gigantopelta aegis]